MPTQRDLLHSTVTITGSLLASFHIQLPHLRLNIRQEIERKLISFFVSLSSTCRCRWSTRSGRPTTCCSSRTPSTRSPSPQFLRLSFCCTHFLKWTWHCIGFFLISSFLFKCKIGRYKFNFNEWCHWLNKCLSQIKLWRGQRKNHHHQPSPSLECDCGLLYGPWSVIADYVGVRSFLYDGGFFTLNSMPSFFPQQVLAKTIEALPMTSPVGASSRVPTCHDEGKQPVDPIRLVLLKWPHPQSHIVEPE